MIMETTMRKTSKTALCLPVGPFRNEPATDFTNPENARRMREALAKVRAELGREYDMVIGDRLIKAQRKIKTINPAHPDQVVAVCPSAGPAHGEHPMPPPAAPISIG